MARKKKYELPSGTLRKQVYDHLEPVYDSKGKPILLPDGKQKMKRVYVSITASTKDELNLKVAEHKLNKKNNNIPSIADITLGKSIENYIELKTPVLSPSTIRGYNNIKNSLQKNYPTLYHTKLVNINYTNLQQFIGNLSAKVSPKTVRNYYGLISSVLTLNGVILPQKTSMPKKVRPDLYIPSDAEIKRLMVAAKDSELEIPIMLAAFGPMRRGEICGIDIKKDISGNIIHVCRSLVLGTDKQWHLKQPKTDSGDRYIEFPDFVINRIKEKGYITHINPHSITILFNRLLESNDIPHFRFHDLRHYSASVQHALGIPDAYIMARGGWENDNVLKNIYRHTMSDRRELMNEKANDHFSNIAAKSSSKIDIDNEKYNSWLILFEKEDTEEFKKEFIAFMKNATRDATRKK